jgi:hypothetical protein
MRRAAAYLTQAYGEHTPRTFAHQAMEMFGNDRPETQRGVARLNSTLSIREGRRYPGSELVVHADGRVAGSTYRDEGVKMLRQEHGIPVRELGGEFYVELEGVPEL